MFTISSIKQTGSLLPSDIGDKVAGLTGGKLAASAIPDIAVVQYLGSAADQASMLGLSGQSGDWCIRIDLGTTWVITGATPSSIGSWTQLSYPVAPVTSVAGKTGAVLLTASDVSGLGTAAQLNATSIVQKVNNVVPDGSGNVNTQSFAAGAVGASAVIIPLATYLLVGAPHTLVVNPANGCTIKIEMSTDNGTTYTTEDTITTTGQYSYVLNPGESAVTHVKLTRTVGSLDTTTYALSGGITYAQYPTLPSPILQQSTNLTQAVVDAAGATGVSVLQAATVSAAKTAISLDKVVNRGSTSGALSTTATTILLSAYGLYGVAHTLTVAPVSGATVTIEVSTNGGTTYTTAGTVTSTAMYPYVLAPGETAVTHLKLTASAGTTSMYSLY